MTVVARIQLNGVRGGTLVDTTIIVAASEEDDEGRWVKHKGRRR